MFRRAHHDDADLRYMRSLAGAVVQRSPRYLILVLLIVALAFASALLWMSYAHVDVVVRGSGKVVPSQQLQIVQSLEGGVVSEILVSEGEIVSEDQSLAKISDIAFSSSLEENRVKYLELKARMTRLRAESTSSDLVPDEEVMREMPEAMRNERSLFESARRQNAEAQEILQQQLQQQQSALAEVSGQRAQLDKRLAIMRQELALKRPLVKRGVITRVEILQLEKQENEVESELDALRLSVPRIQSTIDEARSKLKQGKLDFVTSARRELNEVEAEIARIQEAQSALKDRVFRTTLRSPVRGTVTRMLINTVGGVVAPGGAIMEIVPYADTLLVEIEVQPKDVAKLKVGLPTRLKFSAYDFAIYGSIPGEVVFVSADTITKKDGASHYVVRIQPERDHFESVDGDLPVRVGMQVEADIITDKKTVLEYLLKPINRGFQRALTEG